MNDLKMDIAIEEKERRQKEGMSLILCKFVWRSVYGIDMQRLLIFSVSEDGMQRQSASTCAYLYLNGNLTLKTLN